MKIIITKELEEDFWGTPEELERMTDDEIIELCMEDTPSLLDNALWEIKRR